MNLFRSICLFCIISVSSLPAMSAPGDVLFSDDFERAVLAPWVTTNPAFSFILTGSDVSNSATRGAHVHGGGGITLTSPVISAAVPAAQLTVWVREGSDTFTSGTSENPELGDDLQLEYLNSSSNWVTLGLFSGGGTQGDIFTPTYTLPADALHGGLQLRFIGLVGSGEPWDYWHIDDVVITEIVPVMSGGVLGVGTCEDFEDGLALNWVVTTATGNAGTSSATFQSASNSLFTRHGSVTVTSNGVDTSAGLDTVSMWIREGADVFSENPEAGENLVVEYLNASNAWIALETFVGGGAQGDIFIRDFTMPADAQHANFRIRFRQTAGTGFDWDYWHVDDVCLTGGVLPVIEVQKALFTVISDPINGVENPKVIPGAIVEYAITVTNKGPGTVTLDSVNVSDNIPSTAQLYVNDIGGPGSGPIRFENNAPGSGLTYSFLGLGAATDDVTFFNGGGAPVTPVPDGDGVDAAVASITINPKGTMLGSTVAGDPSFTVYFRTKIN